LSEKTSKTSEPKKETSDKVAESIIEQKLDDKKTEPKPNSLENIEEIKKEEPKPTTTIQKEKVIPKKETSEDKVDSKIDSKSEYPSTEKTVIKKTEPKVIKSKHEWTGNPMLKPKIEKVTVNMSEGKSGAPLQQAVTILKNLTNQEPSKRAAKKTIREFGIRKGESIACLVTIREEKAKEFLRKAFYAIENKLSKYNFDRQGNFSFGIKEHIDLPGVKYAPELGIHGMDVSVSLGRAGYRVKRKHRARSKIGKKHLLTTEEAILFIKDEFDVEIT
jgi:large subunit ribosomal protein L5